MTAVDQNARILVIDDDDIAREVLIETLEAAGHVVFDLPSAIGATRVILRNAVDTVVVDVMLPDIDGDKLARLLRSHARGTQLAIILVSSCSPEELKILASAAGADGVVPKSEIRSTLTHTVAAARRKRVAPSVPQPPQH